MWDIKITKITNCKVYFKVSEREFFLKEDQEQYESMCILYERIKVKENRYVINIIADNGIERCPSEYLEDYRFWRGRTYKNIDINYFIERLIENFDENIITKLL